MSRFALLRFLILALATLSTIIIVAFSSLLTGGETAAARYAEVNVPFGKDLLFLAAVYLIALGLLYRNRLLTLQLPIIIMVLLLMFLWIWGRLSSVFTAREFLQFDFFILMSVVGLIVGSSNARSTIESGAIMSALLIVLSIFAFGSMPELLGPLSLYDPEILERIGTGTGLFFRNSGILLNNNTVGSVLSVLFAYLLYVRRLRGNGSSVDYTMLIIFLAVIVSGNATAALLCSLLYSYSLFTNHYMSAKKGCLLVFVSMLIVFSSAVIVTGYDNDYLAYKFESATVKGSVFLSNLSDFYTGLGSILFGNRDAAFLSESTLIDVIYYFGLPGLILFVILFIFGVTGPFGRVNSLGHKVSNLTLYITIFILLIVQNSVLLPPVSFLFGVMLANSRCDPATINA
jgi:hypothetical protein